MSNEIELIT